MFSSTIIPTIGRPTLARAVESVLQQSLSEADFEVIVVNDSGQPLPLEAWQQSERVHIVTTNRRERSVARNTGAALARGRYLHFLDDDDWLAPGALQHVWEYQPKEAIGWYYGISQLVDRQDRRTIQLRHDVHGNGFLGAMAGEWIPLQSSLISSNAFFAVGGFKPLLAGPEDIDLLRRIALNYEVAGTDGLVAYIGMGMEGSTTNYERHAELGRWAREGILDQATAFARLRPEARSAYWKGRLVRIYLTSIAWNLRRFRLFTAFSRSIHAWQGFILAGRDLLSASFWQSLATAYASPTFGRGLAVATGGPDGADTPTTMGTA